MQQNIIDSWPTVISPDSQTAGFLWILIITTPHCSWPCTAVVLIRMPPGHIRGECQVRTTLVSPQPGPEKQQEKHPQATKLFQLSQFLFFSFILLSLLFQMFHRVGVKDGSLCQPTYVYPEEVKMLLRSVFSQNICDYPDPCHDQVSMSSRLALHVKSAQSQMVSGFSPLAL